MSVRHFHLSLRAHHAVAFDPADLANANRCVDPGHIDARLGNNHGTPGAGIRSAADDLQRALIGVHLADPQLVRIGMFLCLEHLADREGGQAIPGVGQILYLEAQIVERKKDIVQRRISFEMGLEPGQGELHGGLLRLRARLSLFGKAAQTGKACCAIAGASAARSPPTRPLKRAPFASNSARMSWPCRISVATPDTECQTASATFVPAFKPGALRRISAKNPCILRLISNNPKKLCTLGRRIATIKT